MIEIVVVPICKKIEFDRPVSVGKVLKKLELLPNDALVIRNGKLLTRDVRLNDGDKIEIRLVGSRG